MPRVGGPSECSRRLLCATVESILLYGASIWSVALQRETHRQQLMSVQRKLAINISRAYRAASSEALCVVARTPPIDHIVQQRTAIELNGAACRATTRDDR
ncbi:hypothetical protein QE152_g8120 [Popillia japonica]|uniref:Uncharacterized protein n=1 Tax=Popillia japonica TaxID=7064 RepID=A0AAW1MC88_POPJA